MRKIIADHLGRLDHGPMWSFTDFLEPGLQMLQLGFLFPFPHPFLSETARKGDFEVSQVPKGDLCFGTQCKITHNPRQET